MRLMKYNNNNNSVQSALPFKFKGAKRTSCQIGSHTPTSQPLRLHPTPNMDTANKLEEVRSLLEEIYHTQGIDKQETGLALTAIERDNHPPKIRFLKLLNNPTTN